MATWDGKMYVPENTILVKSEGLREREKANIRDYYHIKNSNSIRDGYYSFQLQEFESEISNIDQVRLIAIDHGADTSVAVTPDGRILTYKNPMPPKIAKDNRGKDVKNLLSDTKSYFRGVSGDWIELDFGKINAKNAKLIIVPKVKSAGSVQVQVLEKDQ